MTSPVLGLLVLLSAGAVQDEPWRWLGVRCVGGAELDRPSLVAALELELGAPSGEAAAGLQVGWPCSNEAVVRLRVDGGADGFELQVDLARTPEHLRDRKVALVARELLLSARAVAQLVPEGYVESPLPEPAPRPLGLRVVAGTRMFVSVPTFLFGGGVEWTWRWLRIAVRLDGTGADVPEAALGGLLTHLTVGAMPFQWDQGSGPWHAALGAFLEGGLIATWARARLEGFQGVSSFTPLGGVGARSEAGLVLGRRWRLTLSLDVGFDIGNRVYILGREVLSLHGFFLDLRVGVSF